MIKDLKFEANQEFAIEKIWSRKKVHQRGVKFYVMLGKSELISNSYNECWLDFYRWQCSSMSTQFQGNQN